MEEVSLSEPETRLYSELFQCCDVEKTGKVPMLKATELFRSADIANEAVIEITALAGIPSTALHISRAQFYSCLKLIAAHQAAMPLRQELIAATVQLPLPHFGWKDSPTATTTTSAAATITGASASTCENGIGVLPPPPPTDRRNSLRRNSQQHQLLQQQQQQEVHTSDVPSTDSEVEQNESVDEATGVVGGGAAATTTSSREARHRGGSGSGAGGGGGSPEAWSTNSDSPTPTNSVAERPWAQNTLWHGLLGDEHRQLLGTEEESSDRHSSDDDYNNENELVTIYQITPEQREYYYKQFKAVQRDPHGLLSGHAARIFFEKSRIPVEELRHIWQLCDVTRDGALSLSEFTAAMHLVVLRRNNIPLPTSLPNCLHPSVLHVPQEPPEADLLHLNDDDDDDDGDEHTDNTIVAGNKSRSTMVNDKNIMNLSNISQSSQVSNSNINIDQQQQQPLQQSSNSPNISVDKVDNGSSSSSATTVANQWTKFSESPTTHSIKTTTQQQQQQVAVAATTASGSSVVAAQSSTSSTSAAAAAAGTTAATTVSSPGIKPALFDMKRTAQDVGSNPQILHPVPLRVTPIGNAMVATSAADSSSQDNDNSNSNNSSSIIVAALREPSPKSSTLSNNQHHHQHHQQSSTSSSSSIATAAAATAATTTTINMRDSTDFRAIQRPQAKKLPTKNIGALPPPPQREPSIGNELPLPPPPEPAPLTIIYKKEPPPLPPPRPHRHTRSSSLDLNKFKVGTTQQSEITAQASFDMQTTSSAGFADFTHFADEATTATTTTTTVASIVGSKNVLEEGEQLHSLPPAPPPPPPPSSAAASTSAAAVSGTRISLPTQQRISAFEIYRKPNTPRNSQSPPLPTATTASGTSATQQPTQPPPPAPPHHQLPTTTADNFEKRVSAISDSLRHVSFKQNQTTTTELLHRLREQNNSLLHLCNDLSDELLSVQTRKEEMRLKLENVVQHQQQPQHPHHHHHAAAPPPLPEDAPAARTVSSISAPVTANVTGGSSGSGGGGGAGGYTNI